MEICGYGEDALTLWALRHRLGELLKKIGDSSEQDGCRAYYRPSFGRSGGPNSAQFGEFDFILLTQEKLVLGESKWNRSSKSSGSGQIELPPWQILRHQVFRAYVHKWMSAECDSWGQFRACARAWQPAPTKPLAPPGSLLAKNLTSILKTIRAHFGKMPFVVDTLLYLYDGSSGQPLPYSVAEGFTQTSIDYGDSASDGFIRL